VQAAGQRELADPGQGIGQDPELGFELGRIVDVLPGAATAAPEDGADRVPTRRAGLEQRLHARPREAGLLVHQTYAHAVARRRVRDEDGAPVGPAPDAVSAGGQ
jgi:hypothetical protein